MIYPSANRGFFVGKYRKVTFVMERFKSFLHLLFLNSYFTWKPKTGISGCVAILRNF